MIIFLVVKLSQFRCTTCHANYIVFRNISEKDPRFLSAPQLRWICAHEIRTCLIVTLLRVVAFLYYAVLDMFLTGSFHVSYAILFNVTFSAPTAAFAADRNLGLDSGSNMGVQAVASA